MKRTAAPPPAEIWLRLNAHGSLDAWADERSASHHHPGEERPAVAGPYRLMAGMASPAHPRADDRARTQHVAELVTQLENFVPGEARELIDQLREALDLPR